MAGTVVIQWPAEQQALPRLRSARLNMTGTVMPRGGGTGHRLEGSAVRDGPYFGIE